MGSNLTVPGGNPRSFGQKLAAELERRKIGKRTLARMVDGANAEHMRRSIHKWIDDGVEPTRASRLSVTDALGLPEGALDSEDDEDSSLNAILTRALRAAIETDPDARDALRRMVEAA